MSSVAEGSVVVVVVSGDDGVQSEVRQKVVDMAGLVWLGSSRLLRGGMLHHANRQGDAALMDVFYHSGPCKLRAPGTGTPGPFSTTIDPRRTGIIRALSIRLSGQAVCIVSQDP